MKEPLFPFFRSSSAFLARDPSRPVPRGSAPRKPTVFAVMIIAPSAEANKEWISNELASHAPFGPAAELIQQRRCSCLEIGSGTGQHVAHLAKRFAHVDWQPTEYADGHSGPESRAHDLDEVFASILSHVNPLPNVRPPLEVDASDSSWGSVIEDQSFDAVFVSKVLHIAPFHTTHGVLAGAARVLAPHGRLFIYGAFSVDGKHTSQRNEAFDARLRKQNADWGVRDATEIATLAKSSFHLKLTASIAMPDDDMLLIFDRLQ